MFRVYDKEAKRWVNGKAYLSPNGEIYIIKSSIFGWLKLQPALSHDRYVYHRDIGLYDKNKELVYEGDYIEAQITEEKVVKGIVVYAQEISSYVILCFDSDEYFTLGTEVCEYIEVIGNVFDGFKNEE